MSRYSNTARDERGYAIPGVSIYVYDWDVPSETTGALSDLTNDDLTTPLANPLTTDEFGQFYFNTTNGVKMVEYHFAGKLLYREQIIITPTGVYPGNDSTLRTDLAATGGADLVAFDQATTFASGTVGKKLQQLKAVADYASHAAAMVGAAAAGVALLVSANATVAAANGAALTVPHWSLGPQITTADGNKRGKFFSNVTAAPGSFGNHNSIDTAFNGDLSKSIFQIEHRISGLATLGQPTSGYLYRPEAYPVYIAIHNTSGWNNSTGGNTGRTSAAAIRVNLQQYGQGDLVAFNATAIVNQVRSGATHFLASPAIALFNGDATAGVGGAYLNMRELAANDAGFDVACLMDVCNMNRTNATGALSVWWGAYRVQSTGTQAINNLLSATGKVNVGIDLSMTSLDFGANKAAISLKADTRIYFNNMSSNDNYTTSFTGFFIEYSSAASAVNIGSGGTSVLQVATDRVTMLKPPVLPTVTASALPAVTTGNKGMEYYVSDANSTTRGGNVVGGGSNLVKAYSPGTGSNWIIA